jgi:protocatechuate 3,4-dioxygenase beta subunit
MRHRSRFGLVVSVLSIVALLATSSPAVAANATGIDVRLPSGHTISGKITKKADGTPVAGASITVFGASFSFSFATTAADGTYKVKALADDSYTLSVSPPTATNLRSGYFTNANADHFTESYPGTAIVVNGANVTGKNMKLPNGPKKYSISGKITKAGGTAVANVSVVASGDGYGSTTTGSGGNFTVTGLVPGDYTLYVDAGDGINLQAGCFKGGVQGNFVSDCGIAQTLTITNANLTGKNVTLPAGYKISGVVKDRSGSANPVANAGVTAESQGAQVSRSATTGGDGKFTIVGLSNGTFKVAVAAPSNKNLLDGYYSTANSNKWVAGTGSNVTIASANKSLGTIKPANGFTIKGKLTDKAGNPLSGASVAASGAGFAFTTTKADGTYTLVGLPAGNYTISFSPPFAKPDLQSGWFKSTAATGFTNRQGQATLVTVGPNKTGVNAKLPPGFKISGKVTKAGPVAVTGALVVASQWAGPSLIGSNYQFTDSSGNYQFRGLPDGNFKIQIYSVIPQNAIGGYYKNGAPGNYTANQAQATSITIGP